MLTLSLPIRPMSLNSAYIIVHGRRIPSPTYTKFKKEVSQMLVLHEKTIVNYFKDFKPKTDEIVCSVDFYTPDLYTKSGSINQKSGDVSNITKCIEDRIFSIVPNVDDSAITQLIVRKMYANTILTVIKYEIISRDTDYTLN